MGRSKFNNAVFDAAPAVLFICSAASAIAGVIGYVTTRNPLARASMNVGIGGMVASVLINRWDRITSNIDDNNYVDTSIQ